MKWNETASTIVNPVLQNLLTTLSCR